MAGVVARLKIQDPTAVATIPLSRENHPVTVPITFNKLPTYLDRVWDTMQAIGTRPFSQLDSPTNKMIFLKGMLILSEVKVCYAQRAHVDKPGESLPTKRLYTEELRHFNNMASTLPYPLAIWLESIGNATDGKQIIAPLLAEIAGDENCSGAATFAPRQLLPLLKILHAGVPDSEGLHIIGQALNAIPGFQWKQF
jgi:hypothetical protein